MKDKKIKNLEIRDKNEAGNFEVGQYLYRGQNMGDVWLAEYETYSYQNAVLASHFGELYRFLDFIQYPNDYIDGNQMSLALVEKTAIRIRERIDSEMKAAGGNIPEDFMKAWMA